MKLDRDINENGDGKYWLVKVRTYHALSPGDKILADTAMAALLALGILDKGMKDTEGEFFVLRLKDKYAYRALNGYVHAIGLEDQPDFEYARAVQELQFRSGPYSPFCKHPD